MPLNSALEGKTYPETTFTVDAERVARFREALGGGRDDVPPTFATAAEFTVFPAIVSDPELGLDFTRVVHAEQEYEWRRPLRVGETLTVRARIASIRQKAGTGFLTIRSELVGADGDVAVLAWATLIERAA
ncbi:MAG TPA: MaoC family dehydratase N-terminal domain-containing protein [Actinomycetota bacterium]|nr:MaoC family dehydratase N-terminal domain-containing protein [Actinomycetota bacterium]